MLTNTSIIQDEVLAQRMGLIPLKGSQAGFKWLKWHQRATEDNPVPATHSDYNVCVLTLAVECTWQPGGFQRAVNGETDPNKLYNNHNGTSYALLVGLSS
jgi:DNA-directed RNA polymerase I and III subunit RPAC1